MAHFVLELLGLSLTLCLKINGNDRELRLPLVAGEGVTSLVVGFFSNTKATVVIVVVVVGAGLHLHAGGVAERR